MFGTGTPLRRLWTVLIPSGEESSRSRAIVLSVLWLLLALKTEASRAFVEQRGIVPEEEPSKERRRRGPPHSESD